MDEQHPKLSGIDPFLDRYLQTYEKYPDSKVDPTATLNEPWIQCTREDHLPVDGPNGEWHVDRTIGSVKEEKKSGSYYKSFYNNKERKTQRHSEKKHIQWRKSFHYDNTGYGNGIPRKKAREQAEDYRVKKNLKYGLGTNIWRMVHPIHIELRKKDKTAIVPRAWWEKRRHTYTAVFTKERHSLNMKHRGAPDEKADSKLDLSALRSINQTPKYMKTRCVDGDKLHLCSTNLRTILEHYDTVLLGDEHDGKWNAEYTLQAGNSYKYYRLYAYKYFLIPDIANPNEIPDYVSSMPHDTISVEQHNSYLYWKTEYTKQHESLPADYCEKKLDGSGSDIPITTWLAYQKLREATRLGRPIEKPVEPAPNPKKRGAARIRHKPEMWKKYPHTEGFANPVNPETGLRTRPKSTKPPSLDKRTKSYKRSIGEISIDKRTNTWKQSRESID